MGKERKYGVSIVWSQNEKANALGRGETQWLEQAIGECLELGISIYASLFPEYQRLFDKACMIDPAPPDGKRETASENKKTIPDEVISQLIAFAGFLMAEPEERKEDELVVNATLIPLEEVA